MRICFTCRKKKTVKEAYILTHLLLRKKMTRDWGDKASYHSWRSSKEIQFDSRCFSLYGLMRLDDFFSIRKFRMFEKLLRTFLETTEVTDFTTLGINESTANDACSGIKLYICKLIDRTVNQIKVVQSCPYKWNLLSAPNHWCATKHHVSCIWMTSFLTKKQCSLISRVKTMTPMDRPVRPHYNW